MIRVPYAMTVHGKEEIDAVTKVLETSTQMGEQTREFEEKIAKKIYTATPITTDLNFTQINSLESKTTSVDLINNTIPNLKGLTVREVLFILESMGLEVKIKGSGKVNKQSLNAGTRIKGNQKITIELS